MACGAVRLQPFRVPLTERIHTRRYRLQMRRVDAPSMLTICPARAVNSLAMANMVQLHSFRDWAIELGVGEPVR